MKDKAINKTIIKYKVPIPTSEDMLDMFLG